MVHSFLCDFFFFPYYKYKNFTRKLFMIPFMFTFHTVTLHYISHVIFTRYSFIFTYDFLHTIEDFFVFYVSFILTCTVIFKQATFIFTCDFYPMIHLFLHVPVSHIWHSHDVTCFLSVDFFHVFFFLPTFNHIRYNTFSREMYVIILQG